LEVLSATLKNAFHRKAGIEMALIHDLASDAGHRRAGACASTLDGE
jgi:hypothetical protein